MIAAIACISAGPEDTASEAFGYGMPRRVVVTSDTEVPRAADVGGSRDHRSVRERRLPRLDRVPGRHRVADLDDLRLRLVGDRVDERLRQHGQLPAELRELTLERSDSVRVG